MYPIFRFILEMLLAGRKTALLPGDIHHSGHRCWPWDVDPWRELNNGRTLTLYDLGRLPMADRTGMIRAIRRNNWKMAVAGASVRYRRRVRMFQKIAMKSAVLGWDERFFYFQQTMWHKDEATSSILLRMAVTDRSGILAPARLAADLGWPEVSPPLPDYVTAWINAEAARPWPPSF